MMDGVGSSEGGSITDQRSKAGHGSDISTSDIRFQEQQKGTADTTLSDRSVSVTSGDSNATGLAEVLDTADAIGARVSFYTDTTAWMVQSFIDGNLAQFSALGATIFLDTAALGITKLSPEHVQQAIVNITRTIKDEEVLKCVTLAMDVVTQPGKDRDFNVTTDGSGPKLGKKDTLHQLKAGLKKLNSMGDQGDQVAIGKAKKLITIAQSIAQKKLNMSRGAKVCGVAANVASIAANIAGVIGTTGASLIPCVINVATANLASVGNIAQTAVGEIRKEGVMQQTEGILDGNIAQLKARGIRLASEALPYLRQCNGLAIDVLTHPEKTRDFEGPGGAKFGKKATKQFLGAALKKFDEWTKGVTDPDAQKELAKVRQDIKTAHGVVGSKLNKARAIKGLKISGAVLGTAASVAACVATFGTAAPIAIPAAIGAVAGALGTGISNVKLAYELSGKQH